MTCRLLALSLSILLCPAFAAAAPLAPAGPEFQANSYTTSAQAVPAAAIDAFGNYVVVWESEGSDGPDTDGLSIQGQRFDYAGVPLGSQFPVNTFTANDQRSPAAAMDGSGNFFIAWTSNGSAGSDTSLTSIHAQRFDFSFGIPSGEFQVNSYTTSYQTYPAVAGRPAGGFFVVWSSNGSSYDDSSGTSVQGRLYDGSLTPLTSEFQVNTYTTGGQFYPGVAVNAAGDFVVVWESIGSAGTDTDTAGIQGQRFASSGAPQGSQFQVNTYTTGFQVNPAVAFDTNGNFVVVWTNAEAGGVGSDTDNGSIAGQRYDAAGVPVGGEFQVNTYTTDYQGRPRAAGGASGDLIVVWESRAGGGTDVDTAIKGQRLGAAGTPVGPEFQVNTHTPDTQRYPTLAGNAAGTFVVAWDSYYGGGGSDSSYESVEAQRFEPGSTILGKKILVGDPTSIETNRKLLALGKETATDLGSIGGNPQFTGATLRVILKGAVNSNQTYSLGAAGWTPLSNGGFKYAGPTLGDPVKKVIIKRTPGGVALVKALLRGNIGTQSLNAVPPNPGNEGGIILSIPGFASYCASFGGAAGGTETSDDAGLWKVVDATAEDCPLP